MALFWARRSASCAKVAKVRETESEHEFAPSVSIGRQTHLETLNVDRKDRREEGELEEVVDDEDDRAEADPFSHDLSKPASGKIPHKCTRLRRQTHRNFHPPKQAKREEFFDDQQHRHFGADGPQTL